ncbi:hypothetical protein RhiirA4_472095 [Rhizophagus irregularis]|uniref:Uncharacterized protein n=1 Tax=Rhizophagus irregularis TaxID=588596 RepID=A0A2I1H4C7_9GLOM|nr:hypothetical protein RhiirA4_472095 [Rhizophagus irregularis]
MKNEEWVKQLLTWIQEAISSRQLGNPGTPGTGILSRFLKKAEFLSKTGKPLLPSSLYNLGAVFAVVASGIRNLLKANTIANQALRHSPKNNTAPSQRYTIVFKLNEQNAEVYSTLSEEIKALTKRLNHYCSQHKKLKKRVKPLEERVKWLDDNVNELFTMEYCNCSKEFINTSSESSSSEEFDSNHVPSEKKYLPNLKHTSSINDIWEREVNLEWPKRHTQKTIVFLEYTVTEPDWPDQFPEILLGSP